MGALRSPATDSLHRRFVSAVTYTLPELHHQPRTLRPLSAYGKPADYPADRHHAESGLTGCYGDGGSLLPAQRWLYAVLAFRLKANS